MILSTYREQILTSNEIVKSTNRNVNVNMAIYYVGGLKNSIDTRKRTWGGGVVFKHRSVNN